jgi:hypothetical protein
MKAKFVDSDLRRSATEHRFDITAAARHVKNKHVYAINPIDHEILTYGKTSQARAQIVAEATYIGMIAKKKETVGNGINQAISNLYAATISGYVVPDIIKLNSTCGASR